MKLLGKIIKKYIQSFTGNDTFPVRADIKQSDIY